VINNRHEAIFNSSKARGVRNDKLRCKMEVIISIVESIAYNGSIL
jgi:hypothetical protein